MNGIESKMIRSQEKMGFSPVNPTGGLSVMKESLFYLKICLEMSSFFLSLTSWSLLLKKKNFITLNPLIFILLFEKNLKKYWLCSPKWIGLSPLSTFQWIILNSKEKKSWYFRIKNEYLNHLTCYNNKINHIEMTFQRTAISEPKNWYNPTLFT